MDATNPPTRPPTAVELLTDPTVQLALEQAWIDSKPDNPAQRHEEGGWIYMDTANGQLTVQRAQPGTLSAVDLTGPAVIGGSVVVGKFHTHHNPTADGWDPGPSRFDQLVDARHGVPDLIRADDGVYVSGPQSRRGGLGGGPGYPP